MTAIDWKAFEHQYYMQCTRQQSIVLARGEGIRVWDETGKSYLDFTAGWAVNNLGHVHPVLLEARRNQTVAPELGAAVTALACHTTA